MIRVPGLCEGGDRREGIEPVALLGSDLDESTRDPEANDLQSPPALEAVCVGVCVWIFICVPCTRECMNWRELLSGGVLNNKVCLA